MDLTPARRRSSCRAAASSTRSLPVLPAGRRRPLGRAAWVERRSCRGGAGPHARLRNRRAYRSGASRPRLPATWQTSMRSEGAGVPQLPRPCWQKRAAGIVHWATLSHPGSASTRRPSGPTLFLLQTMFRCCRFLPGWRAGARAPRVQAPRCVCDSGLLAYLLSADRSRIAPPTTRSRKGSSRAVAVGWCVTWRGLTFQAGAPTTTDPTTTGAR